MRNLYRGLRNVWRNRSRTAVVLVILALAACLGLVMLALEEGVRSQIGEMEARVGTIVEVRPAGTYGMMSLTDSLLPNEMVQEIAAMEGVAEVSPYVMGRIGFQVRPSPGAGMGFAGVRMVFGIAPGKELTVLGGGQVEIVAGRNLEPGDEGKPVVVVGDLVAENEGVGVGDYLLINDLPFQVVGIHRSQVRMAGVAVFMPYDVAQETFGITGLNQIYVRAETLGQVDEVREALLAAYGDTVDVVAQKDAMQRLEDSLSSLNSASRVGLLLSLLASAIVVFATMFLVVRERAREIGILKAIGAGRGDIVLQFASEAVSLSMAGALLGLVLFTTLGTTLASMVMGAAGPTAAMPNVLEVPRVTQGMAPRAGGGQVGRVFVGGGRMGLAIGTMEVSLTWSLAAQALLGGIGLGLAGGLLPSVLAAQLKPAEVIRRD